MKRSTRVFGDRVLRSRRRLFATTIYEEDVKRARLSPVSVEEQEKIKLGEIQKINGEEQQEKIKLGEFQEENGGEQQENIKLGDSKKVEGGEQKEEIKIKLGESKIRSLVDDHNHDDNVSFIKQFGAVYTRKRKRTTPKDSSISSCITFEEKCGSDNRYAKKYFKKVKTSLRTGCGDSEMGFDGKDVSLKGSDDSFSHCSYGSGDSSSSSIHQVSCFFSSNGIQFLQDSTPFFTVDMNSLPFCFLYIHSTLLLKFAFLSYAFILNSVDENVVNDNKDDVKLPLIVTTEKDQTLDKHTIVRKARSARKTVPRVALFKKSSQRNVWAHVENIVPVPGVREIEGYGGDDYVPFKLPELYISSRSDEVTRSLEKSYPIYDMDSDDERWLKELNKERFGDNKEPLSEDSLEKIIDAFERGSYCTPDCFSDAASAIDRCSTLASKENVEAVYSYWMTKRKKKRSSLIRVFQCYPRKRARRYLTSAVIRKKRSSRRRASQRCAGKQLDFFKAAIMNDENKLAKELVKVHEAEESAKRAEAAAIVKRKEAQSAMETADLATYRAAMALRIAAQVAAAGGESVVDCL
ncbi:hypothetical protein OSB04_026751 [Centaurea solstitialis]|uniref:Enhancer of polycomb-like protein n=1 Tax=Centaurea solstitialis TaxID=347529 RepID=A0AA38W665_9ASTR|nr:hypothetical protein OSB04_026751 [Centaurea solstitialis]